jgi:hypothetical protein
MRSMNNYKIQLNLITSPDFAVEQAYEHLIDGESFVFDEGGYFVLTTELDEIDATQWAEDFAEVIGAIFVSIEAA